jgi:hypothetical protein
MKDLRMVKSRKSSLMDKFKIQASSVSDHDSDIQLQISDFLISKIHKQEDGMT